MTQSASMSAPVQRVGAATAGNGGGKILGVEVFASLDSDDGIYAVAGVSVDTDKKRT